jgi:hypothetical protein
MMNKMGYASTTPTAIRHGPITMGGIDLLDLRTEVGISQIKYLRDAVYSDSEAGRLIILNVNICNANQDLAFRFLKIRPFTYRT